MGVVSHAIRLRDITKFPTFYLPKKGAEEQHLKEQIDNHRTLLN